MIGRSTIRTPVARAIALPMAGMTGGNLRGHLRGLEGVASDVGVLDDLVGLVVVAEDDELITELTAASGNCGREIGGDHFDVRVRERGLPEHGGW